MIQNPQKILSWFMNQLKSSWKKISNQFACYTNDNYLVVGDAEKVNGSLYFQMMKELSFHPQKLRNVHFGVLQQQSLTKQLIKPNYVYFHYNQDIKDEGYGCAYRSLQTILSWYHLNGRYKGEIPSILEIQQLIAKIEKRDPKFIGSSEWIGSMEISYVLQHLVGVDCQILNFSSGSEILSYLPALKEHF